MLNLSDKNNMTGEAKDLLLAKLLEVSKKHRIKSIADRYNIKLSEKNTKQQMIDATLPAIEMNFGVKLKHYSTEELKLAMKCFTENEISSQLAEEIMNSVAKGEVCIPCNINHKSISAEGIGAGLRTKINVNLGISGDCKNYDVEMQKVDMALKFGAEAIMDLSNYGKTNTFRQELIKKSPAMIGTVLFLCMTLSAILKRICLKLLPKIF